MLETVGAVAGAIALVAVWGRRRVAGYRLASTLRSGFLCTQLWRRTALFCPHEGPGLQVLPSPRESRLRVTRVAGVPLWWREQAVGLPMRVADALDEVKATDFDAAFTQEFRVQGGSRGEPARARVVARASRI